MSHLTHSLGSSFIYLLPFLYVFYTYFYMYSCMYCSECCSILTVGTIYKNKRGSYFWWKFVLKDNHFCNILSFCACLCNATLCHLPSKSGLLKLALYHINVLRGFAASGPHSLGSEELCEQMWLNVFGNQKTKEKDHVEKKRGLLSPFYGNLHAKASHGEKGHLRPVQPQPIHQKPQNA